MGEAWPAVMTRNGTINRENGMIMANNNCLDLKHSREYSNDSIVLDRRQRTSTCKIDTRPARLRGQWWGNRSKAIFYTFAAGVYDTRITPDCGQRHLEENS